MTQVMGDLDRDRRWVRSRDRRWVRSTETGDGELYR